MLHSRHVRLRRPSVRLASLRQSEKHVVSGVHAEAAGVRHPVRRHHGDVAGAGERHGQRQRGANEAAQPRSDLAGFVREADE